MEKLKEMRTAAFQQMEPALQGLLDKNKEEVRRAFEEADQRAEAVRSKGMQERRDLQMALDQAIFD